MQAEPLVVQQNALVIFDYVGPTDFKFAGAFVGTNRWSIGHRTAASWVKDATFNQTINTSTDYGLDVVVQNGTDVTLSVDGALIGPYSFGDTLTDGMFRADFQTFASCCSTASRHDSSAGRFDLPPSSAAGRARFTTPSDLRS